MNIFHLSLEFHSFSKSQQTATCNEHVKVQYISTDVSVSNLRSAAFARASVSKRSLIPLLLVNGLGSMFQVRNLDPLRLSSLAESVFGHLSSEQIGRFVRTRHVESW